MVAMLLSDAVPKQCAPGARFGRRTASFRFAPSERNFGPQLEHHCVPRRRVGVGMNQVLKIRLDRQPVSDLGEIRRLDDGFGPIDGNVCCICDCV
jgi:hypothetical protein